jgi:endonuclease G
MIKQILVSSLFFLFSTNALAVQEFSECRHLFVNGSAPVMPAASDLQLRALCFSSFAVLHSGKSRTPVYVAERLNKETLTEAKENKRSNNFFSDARLPRSERAELEDFKGSGYDRGHMAPAADMATSVAMSQSFSLANMVPQAPENNRKAWASIEKATRKYVMRASGDVYVITGPVFDKHPESIGRNKVWVPRHLFKMVYDPATQKSWAYWLENTDDARPGKPISYAQLVERTGINFMPGASRQAQ